MKRFLQRMFQDYEAGDYTKHWEHTFAPEMLFFQIATWVYLMYIDRPIATTTVDKISCALTIGFGGLGIYFIFGFINLLLSAFLNEKPYIPICIVLGVIGTYMAFNVL